MQHRKTISFLLTAFAVLLFYACSNTRKLTGDQLLYNGRGKVTIVNKEQFKDAKLAEKISNEVTFFKPNGAMFGTRRIIPPFGLWTYNYCKPKGDGKIANWFYKTFSKEPILVSHVNPEQRCRKIESDLFGSGFFNSKAWFQIDTNAKNPRKAKISYFIGIDNPFRINKILYTSPVNAVDSLINSWKEDFAIKPGDIFSLETVKSEKRKIASRLVEDGYYFFMPEYIQIIADTSANPFQIDLLVARAPETPEYACRKYTIDQIKVNLVGVRIDSSIRKASADTIYYDGIYLSGLNNYLKPEVITRSIQFRSGDLYSTSKHQGTIMRLNNYAIFKYVKMQFILQDSIHQKMNLVMEASPRNDVSLNMEGYIESQSSGFSGPGVEATLAHANLSRGANKLQLKLTGGFQWQWGTNTENNLGTNSYNLGVNSSFVFPRLVLPFKYTNQSKLLVTKTIISLGYEFMNNIQYYRMSALKLGLSYQWKKRPKITNVFSPVTINLANLLETTPEFDTIVNENPYVKKSFEEQYIAGMEYSFIYDNTTRQNSGTYLLLNMSTSGNLFDFVKSRTGGERPYTIMGNVYSQFVKTSADFRFYTHTAKEGLVFRLYSGVGFSYKNSTVMPYIEQYYSGGSNSIRAFAARSLGPGSYKPEDANGIIDQTGDIKLEGNIEYRFSLSKMVKGAFFVDAGNVWLLNIDENRPGAEFVLDSFVNQLAVGTGAGLRFDFDFFVLRTDVGLPLRKTYNDGNGNWYRSLNDIRYYSIFNLAIGYPF